VRENDRGVERNRRTRKKTTRTKNYVGRLSANGVDGDAVVRRSRHLRRRPHFMPCRLFVVSSGVAAQ